MRPYDIEEEAMTISEALDEAEARLSTGRREPSGEDIYAIAEGLLDVCRALAEQVDKNRRGLLAIGSHPALE